MTQLGLHDTSFGLLLNETLSKSSLYQAILSLTFRFMTNIDEGQINQWCSTTLQFYADVKRLILLKKKLPVVFLSFFC